MNTNNIGIYDIIFIKNYVFFRFNRLSWTCIYKSDNDTMSLKEKFYDNA